MIRIGKADIAYYDKDRTSERRMEIGLGLDFIKRFPAETILEVGAVIPAHESVEHKVLDLFDKYEKCIREDAVIYDYTGKNVLSISTVEHIGRDDYKRDGVSQELKPENAAICLEKIIKESSKYLITIPIGYNTYLDDYVSQMSTPKFCLVRDEKNEWSEYPDENALKLQYGKPYDFANGLIVLTNIEDFFSNSGLSIHQVITRKPETGRNESFKLALIYLYNNYGMSPINIVETGTIRNINESAKMSDGWGTINWKYWAWETNSKVWTCDIDLQAIESCKRLTGDDPNITYVVNDSVDFLSGFRHPIHFLYLDNFDTGTPEQIIGACNHQLKEAQAAIDKLDSKALILLDDIHGSSPEFRGGKGELSIKYLFSQGWKVLNHDINANQVLLAKY